MVSEKETRGGHSIYNIRFRNLTDLYDYLKENPTVNTRVFSSQASLKSDKSFYGEPLDKSIEYIMGGYTKGFDNFLKTSDDLKKIGVEDQDDRTLKRGLYGGIPLAPLVAAGVPDCMLRYYRSEDVKYVTIYFNLAYPHFTTEAEIVNRGLATLYLIQALENKGYIVNFKAFELSHCNNETINISIDLKKPGDLFLNIEKCYFPIKAKEFLRRILFRVLESSEVTSRDWSGGYGRSASIEEMKDFFDAGSHDLIIAAPREMGICGENIYTDTLTLIKKLKIEEEFDVERIKTLAKQKDQSRRNY